MVPANWIVHRKRYVAVAVGKEGPAGIAGIALVQEKRQENHVLHTRRLGCSGTRNTRPAPHRIRWTVVAVTAPAGNTRNAAPVAVQAMFVVVNAKVKGMLPARDVKAAGKSSRPLYFNAVSRPRCQGRPTKNGCLRSILRACKENRFPKMTTFPKGW